MILVVGPGRSGTSAVARYLHEHGVSMGERLVPDHWEDAEFHWLNQGRLIGRLGKPAWLAGVKSLIKQRKEPWGLKDPRVAEIVDEYLPLLDARIIRCRRPFKDVVASCMRVYDWPKSAAEELVKRRERNLDEHLPDDVFEFICGETRLEDIPLA